MVTSKMQCNATSDCDWETDSKVLQPDAVALANGATNYYTYFTCQTACSADYFALANGTCSKHTTGPDTTYCLDTTVALINVGVKGGV